MSTRYLPAITVVLALACVPTVLHTYIGSTTSDSRCVTALPMTLNGLHGRPSGRSPAWVMEAYGTSDFIERQYGTSLTLFVARSHDIKRLYHHPEHGVARGDNYDPAVIVRAQDRPEIPIFVLRNASDKYSAYALLYGDGFVERPMSLQLRNAFVLLVRPRQLMTLFFVRGSVDGESATARSPVEGLLRAAIDSFLAQPARE